MLSSGRFPSFSQLSLPYVILCWGQGRHVQGSPSALFTDLGPWTASVCRVTESSHLVGSRAMCCWGSLVPNFISAQRPLVTSGQRLPKACGTKLGHQKRDQGPFPRVAGPPCPAGACKGLGSWWTWTWSQAGRGPRRGLSETTGMGAGSSLPTCAGLERGDQACSRTGGVGRSIRERTFR